MQFTVEAGEMTRALKSIKGVVERRTTIPILSHMLVASAAGGLTLTGTDLDMQATAEAPTQSGGVGAAAFPSLLLDFLSKLPPRDLVAVDWDKKREVGTFTSGKVKFKFKTLPADDFPQLQQPDGMTSFRLPPGDLASLLGKVAYAVCADEARYYLGGIYLHIADGKIVAVATDGHRLGRTAIAAPDEALAMPSVIVSRAGVRQILGLLDGLDCDVEIAVAERMIRVSAGPRAFVLKNIDGSYPDYRRVIPAEPPEVATVSAAGLAAALERVAVILERAETQRATLEAVAGDLQVSTRSRNGHDAEDTVAADIMAGGHGKPPWKANFNVGYLRETLGLWGAENVVLAQNTPDSPLLIVCPATPEDRHVIMPMR